MFERISLQLSQQTNQILCLDTFSQYMLMNQNSVYGSINILGMRLKCLNVEINQVTEDGCGSAHTQVLGNTV